VLVAPDRLPAVRHTVIEQTTAIGMREHRVVKHPLGRDIRTVLVRGLPVRVKVAFSGDLVVNVMPEFDDVAAAAARLGVPAKLLLAEAMAAAHEDATRGRG
jgi:pyridinium-3,5-bisthiocarboxylic acid mononucleotide nickel chelatase